MSSSSIDEVFFSLVFDLVKRGCGLFVPVYSRGARGRVGVSLPLSESVSLQTKSKQSPNTHKNTTFTCSCHLGSPQEEDDRLATHGTSRL